MRLIFNTFSVKLIITFSEVIHKKLEELKIFNYIPITYIFYTCTFVVYKYFHFHTWFFYRSQSLIFLTLYCNRPPPTKKFLRLWTALLFPWFKQNPWTMLPIEKKIYRMLKNEKLRIFKKTNWWIKKLYCFFFSLWINFQSFC